ncbi:MAG: hypothetical protein M5T61_19015 [Acidimicrobiia bacterium]|nr:hypothetical protein [Acidimicrobiia bacterium]
MTRLADRLGRRLARWLGAGIEQRLAARRLADAARATDAVCTSSTRSAMNPMARRSRR